MSTVSWILTHTCGLLRLGVAALMSATALCASNSFADPVAPPALPSTASVDTPTLHSLGFLTPGEVSITDDEYVQLVITLYVPGGQTDALMNRCPASGIWGIDVSNLTSGDNHTTFGAQISNPSVATPVNLNPLDFSTTASGFLGFGTDCHLKIDVIKYLSPVYFVRKTRGAQFTITPTYEVTKALNVTIQNDLDGLVGAAVGVAGVPAAAAAPYLAQLKTNLGGAKTDSTNAFIQHPVIASGPNSAALTWTVNDAIRKTKTTPAQPIVLIAQLLPVATIVPTPADNKWSPGRVLASAFNVNVPATPTPTDGTLGGYLSIKASTQLLAYANATTDDGANIACGAIAGAIDAIGLSDRDAALALWAEAEQRVIAGKADRGSVDAMACLTDAWNTLAPLGMTATPKVVPPPTTPVPAAGAAPKVTQMKVTTEINDAFARFFVSPAWTDQTSYTDQLFSWPVTYNDRAAALMRQSGPIANAQSWLVNEYGRDQPILAQVGCYAYFDANADPTGFAKSIGAHSLVLAIGTVGQNGTAAAGKEVGLMATFGESPGGDAPKIAQIDVQTSLTPAARQAMLAQIRSKTQCPSGYRPQMLFGP